jgi:hypothetical protein
VRGHLDEVRDVLQVRLGIAPRVSVSGDGHRRLENAPQLERRAVAHALRDRGPRRGLAPRSDVMRADDRGSHGRNDDDERGGEIPVPLQAPRPSTEPRQAPCESVQGLFAGSPPQREPDVAGHDRQKDIQ